MIRTITLAALCLATADLAACTDPLGSSNRTGTGALVGAATGAAVGNLIGEDSRSTLIGATVGALAGTAIGNRLDRQAAELQQSLGGSGAGVVNTGSALIVSLPEAITFDTGSAAVRPGLQDELAALSRSLQNYPDTTVQVVGHTDNVGSVSYNQTLSERRAFAVTDVLVDTGTPAFRVRASGRGLVRPIASNDTVEGRAANRRVEVIITPQA